MTGRPRDNGLNILQSPQYTADIQVSKSEADEHPFPSRRAVAVFCVMTTELLALDLSAHTLTLSFLE